MDTAVILNTKQKLAWKKMVEGESVFVTGPGGVGKTLLMKKFASEFNSKKIIGVTSTTGISALIFGGTTFHSFTGIGLGTGSVESIVKNIKSRSYLKKRWKDLDTLIIDEISMLSPQLFDKVEEVARIVRCSDEPFGGVQIIASGDFLQLPCVDTDKFTFDAKSWDRVITSSIYLTEIVRQKDTEFQEVLNDIRVGNLSEKTRQILTEMNKKKPIEIEGIRPTLLYPVNAQVDTLNDAELDIIAETGQEFREYTRQIKVASHVKNKKYALERFSKNTIIPSALQLAVGAQVMLIINLDIDAGLVNGSRGVVRRFCEDMPEVQFMNGQIRVLDYHLWEPEENDRKIMKVIQVPLKIAYALTIHKSQGATLDYVRVDLSRIFEYGQAYVALSRASNMEGLTISGLDFDRIKASPRAVEYYKSITG